MHFVGSSQLALGKTLNSRTCVEKRPTVMLGEIAKPRQLKASKKFLEVFMKGDYYRWEKLALQFNHDINRTGATGGLAEHALMFPMKFVVTALPVSLVKKAVELAKKVPMAVQSEENNCEPVALLLDALGCPPHQRFDLFDVLNAVVWSSPKHSIFIFSEAGTHQRFVVWCASMSFVVWISSYTVQY